MEWVLLALAVVLLFFGVVVFRGAPYVPSRKQDLAGAFDELYAVGEDDTLVDIGSGDGVVLRLAARRGAKAVGYELNPLLVIISKWLSRHDDKVQVRWADAWRQDVPADTTVVYVFSTSRDIEKIASWVDDQATKLGRELFLMSYGFELQRTALRRAGPHYLYHIKPLQTPVKTV